jgi:D-glycero-D-manno-heptose 1,7-bisphosphate phosphatase
MATESVIEPRPAVFLDRDGTINVEKEYLHRVEDFDFIPGAPEAIRRLKEAGFLIIVVTNQSGVARGYYPVSAVETLHRHMQEELGKYGTAVDAFYLCPHHPRDGVGEYRIDCACRKGHPGMLLQAAADLAIDLKNSWMVGDKAVDIEAGERAGCTPVLVLTGYGGKENDKVDPHVHRFADLQAAAEFILAR